MPEEPLPEKILVPKPAVPLESARETFPPVLPAGPGTVALVGKVAGLRRGPGLFSLEAGGQKIEVHCPDTAMLAFLKEGTWARAIGKPDPASKGLEAGLVQELKGMEEGMLERVQVLEKKAYPEK